MSAMAAVVMHAGFAEGGTSAGFQSFDVSQDIHGFEAFGTGSAPPDESE
jgi:hypothetical protein